MQMAGRACGLRAVCDVLAMYTNLPLAEPGASSRAQLRDGPDALGHCSPLCQQNWHRRPRARGQSNRTRPLARLKGNTAGVVRKVLRWQLPQVELLGMLGQGAKQGWAGLGRPGAGSEAG